MNQRILENRAEEIFISRINSWKKIFRMSMRKRIPMGEAYLIFFFLEDIKNASKMNSILKFKNFILLLLADYSEITSVNGLRQFKRTISYLLENILSEINTYTREEKEKKWEKIFNIFFESGDFIRDYNGRFNEEIYEFSKGVLLSAFSNDLIPEGNEAVVKCLQSFEPELLARFSYV